ncbi:MAG: hypothetical protein M3Q97_03610, partial [Bacteroidota bacterium]|nr:hypothetical protein [Bacteroidota bacterium]
MKETFGNHINEVRGHYNASDFLLAHRRLIDCAIETQDAGIFRSTLNYSEWLESHEDATGEEITTRAFHLLDEIRKAGIKKVPDPDKEILSVAGLKKTYAKSNFRIEDLNFNLHLGEIIGLV